MDTFPKDLAIPTLAPLERHFEGPDPRLDSSDAMAIPNKNEFPLLGCACERKATFTAAFTL
jgi:hypothetical protein